MTMTSVQDEHRRLTGGAQAGGAQAGGAEAGGAEAGAQPLPDDVPLEHLEQEITTLAGQIAAVTSRFLVAIAAYDRREGWGTWGCQSMVHWLTWRTAMSAPTAREHLRVARALEDLPLVAAELSVGRLSYSQVRALTRIAVPATEVHLVDLARHMTASQLDRLARSYRNIRTATTETAQERAARRRMVSYLDDDGMRVIIVRQPPEDGERILRAVDAVVKEQAEAGRRARAAAEPGIDPEEEDSMLVRRADALVELVERAMAVPGDDQGPREPTTLVVIHTETSVLAGAVRAPSGGDGTRDRDSDNTGERHGSSDGDADASNGAGSDGVCHVQDGSALAAETARRLACDAPTITASHQPDGTIAYGRRSRRVPTAMRRALVLRDRTCVFPGCDAVRGTDAHHVRFWGRGGPTVLANLALLCRFHHHRVHEGGYGMRAARPDESPDGTRWVFSRPDGRAIPAVPSVPRADGLPQACDEVEAEACVPEWDGAGLDRNWVIEGLLQMEGLGEYAPDPTGRPDWAEARAVDFDDGWRDEAWRDEAWQTDGSD